MKILKDPKVLSGALRCAIRSLYRTESFSLGNKSIAIFDATIRENSFTSENIFNGDESGFSTVQKRPPKNFAAKGRKQVGALCSAKRGKVTVVCAISAIGRFVPPVFIFSRKRFKNEGMDKVPPSSKAFCQERG
ncbi:hypothetical protein MML48_3g00008557 [Holotrichia oblita]|uniref:Uncharacterized protein n=1 Tax=Holotrichia oblita TaxID=644536 RepID=A0ACB9TFA3_HOLOL|nr:hypothetical protein MML48_3g00008557 [Holotrichia oblita]